MPASVRRHNLVRLRDELNLTQAGLAEWIGRASTTIKSIEIGRLALSPKLAELIAAVTGADAGWLLRNDSNEPMPELKRISAKLEPAQEAYNYLCLLLWHLFDRLLAALGRLKKTQARTVLELYIKHGLDSLKGIDQVPDAEPATVVGIDVFEFFKAHPEFLDPDLASLINLDFLIKDAHRVAQSIKVYDRRIDAAARLAAQLPKPRPRKSPSRSRGLPSPGDRRKKPKSS
jgi:DNA-binding XRE family transcriptional regulator